MRTYFHPFSSRKCHMMPPRIPSVSKAFLKKRSLNQHHKHQSRVSRNVPLATSIRKGSNSHGTTRARAGSAAPITGLASPIGLPIICLAVGPCARPSAHGSCPKPQPVAQALIRFPGNLDVEDSLWNPRLLAYAPNPHPNRSHGDVHPRNRRWDSRIIHEFSVGHKTHHQFHPLPLMRGPDWPA